MYVNGMKILMWIGIAAAILLFLWGMFATPLIAQDALDQCMDRGYSSYEDYTSMFLNLKAYAVRCKDMPPANTSIAISIAK